MTHSDTLLQHHRLCDDLYQCVLDENRFLRQHQTAPGEALLARKKILLGQLDDSLKALRLLPAVPARDAAAAAQLEKTRSRILQVIQLDKENEQLLLKCSLAGHRPTAGAAPAPASALLQKIYSRCK